MVERHQTVEALEEVEALFEEVDALFGAFYHASPGSRVATTRPGECTVDALIESVGYQ